ncbi:MAG: glucosaminidase domain-containing protein [Peptostreptococcaceae bacterium]|nr:glucosaminidase domain-containing protein [Peptostreptococcaceae bacterium]
MRGFIVEVEALIRQADPLQQILPSLLLAQACLESDFGRSKLAVEGKNLFGVKGKGCVFRTKEFMDGQWKTVQAEFQRYDSWKESVQAQMLRFTTKRRYQGLIGLRDYQKACYEVYRAGYATDPRYPEKLIAKIEEWKLDRYDKEGNMVDRKKIVEAGERLIGTTRYKLGAKAAPPQIPPLLDCSGFVRYCYLAAGVHVPDGTYHQWHGSVPVSKPKIGDIGIMQDPGKLNGTINHIGMYAGDGYWIHCSYGHDGVRKEKTDIFKYPRRFKDVKFEEEEMKIAVSEKELGYGIKAIERLGELGILNSPKVHIDHLKKDPSVWALWVVQAKMAERMEEKK